MNFNSNIVVKNSEASGLSEWCHGYWFLIDQFKRGIITKQEYRKRDGILHQHADKHREVAISDKAFFDGYLNLDELFIDNRDGTYKWVWPKQLPMAPIIEKPLLKIHEGHELAITLWAMSKLEHGDRRDLFVPYGEVKNSIKDSTKHIITLDMWG